MDLVNSIKNKNMKITDKIKQSCEEIIELCNADVMSLLGKVGYKYNPNPTDFNEEREAVGIEAHERTLEDWAEEHGATCDNEGNWSV